MQFKDIVGQGELKSKLIQTVNDGRISHAQLFLGKCGYGVLPLAIAYAQYVNCMDKQDKDSCGKCNSCKKIEKLAHPDLHFSYPVNTNKEIKSKPVSNSFLQSWREINIETPYFSLNDWHNKIGIEQRQSIINVEESKEIIKKLGLKPFESEHKILILFKAENLNNQASNKLLKLIEEPTDKTIIILIAEEEEQLLKTIASRVQTVRVPPISNASIKEYLIHEKNVEIGKVEGVEVNFFEGDYIEALLRLRRSEEDEFFLEFFKVWMRASYEANIDRIYAWVEEISARSFGREKQKRFLVYALTIIREGIVHNYMGEQLMRLDNSASGFMRKFAPFIHGGNAVEIMELLNNAYQHISRNAYAKILFMDMSMRFANLLKVKKG